MLSRVAESIYWMCRYVERAENIARFIDVNHNLSIDLPAELGGQWEPLLLTTSGLLAFQEDYEAINQENVISFLALDKKNPNSILSSLHQARENARSVREIISSEMWRHINEMYLTVKENSTNANITTGDSNPFFRKLITDSSTFIGLMDTTFSHGEAWHFGILGRYMERSDKTARIIDMKYYYLLPSINHVGTTIDILQWLALLKSASAFEMYRKSFGKLDIKNIIRFLALDRNFPRSIRYSLVSAERSLHEISGSKKYDFANLPEKRMGMFRSELDYTDVDEIVTKGLHEYLTELLERLNSVGESIDETFFQMRE
ncbi:MAG: alpha-E domain-containing protein [Leptospiraceae bacterium]|nr:alpha-E domain-containing protein [Leptospiraceae bacterium]